MTDLQKLRDELAIIGAKIHNNHPIQDNYASYLYGFQNGFDAGVAEMQAQNNISPTGDMLTYKELAELLNKIIQERDIIKQALDVSINMHKKIESNPRWAQNNSTKALASINEILNKTKQGE